MLKARIITALFLLAGLSYALFGLSDSGWIAFVALVIGLAGWEWGRLAVFPSAGCIVYGLATAAFYVALTLLAGPSIRLGLYLLSAAFWIILVPLFLARRPGIGKPPVAALLGWLVLLPASLAMVQLHDRGPLVLFAVMAAVWVADIGAYFVGRAFGKRKLAPAISPGKSWEGAYGGAAGVMIYGFVVAFGAGFMTGVSVTGIAALTLALLLFAAVSVEGDLFESLLKRQAGIKDSSNLLPGHGGVLDRIDSLTSTLPLAGLALSLINL